MWHDIVTHPFFYHGMLLVGLLLCVLSIYFLFNTIIFLGNSETASGKIIKLIENGQPSGHENETTWSPIVEYKDVNGDTHKFECYSSHSTQFTWGVSRPAKPEFKVGDIVNVIYISNDPTRAKINTWQHIWLLTVSLGMSGVGLIWDALRNL